ncbi:MAG TPA: GntR family transcriptional regulator [Microlunatus sp.]|nr:GntR family transcriptional regulator [Microlunatus sp.]
MTMRVPKYYAVKGELLQLIEGAAVGTILPTERELADRFATSRTTVRQAIAELVVEGRLERTQGSGTYVAEPKLIQLRQLSSFTEDIGERRSDARSEVLDISRVAADAEVAAALGLTRGAKVQRVERLRIVSDEPIAHEVAHLTGSFPRLSAELGRRGSLYLTLSQAYGVDLAAAEDVVETALASPTEAQLLGVDTGLPMLLVRRTASDGDGHPREYTRSVFRGDRFRFVARFRR